VGMEKRGVIDDEHTPPENKQRPDDLDSHVSQRLKQAAEKAVVKKSADKDD